nr:hypothetical protein [Tanacetum cinerariifolium]
MSFVGGSWSDSAEEDDEKAKDETGLMPQASSENHYLIEVDHIEIGENTNHENFSFDNLQIGCNLLHDVQTSAGFLMMFVLRFSGPIKFKKDFVFKKLKSLIWSFVEEDSSSSSIKDCLSSKAYIILNKDAMKIEESLSVTFDETPPPSKTSPLVDDDLDEEEAITVTEKKNLENDIEDETQKIDEIVNIKESKNHLLDNVIGNLNLKTLRNKLDENGIVSWNKAMLVAQGYNQQEGTDYDETCAHVAGLESIRIILAYACALDFKLFQIDIKSAFLNGFINGK